MTPTKRILGKTQRIGHTVDGVHTRRMMVEVLDEEGSVMYWEPIVKSVLDGEVR